MSSNLGAVERLDVTRASSCRAARRAAPLGQLIAGSLALQLQMRLFVWNCPGPYAEVLALVLGQHREALDAALERLVARAAALGLLPVGDAVGLGGDPPSPTREPEEMMRRLAELHAELARFADDLLAEAADEDRETASLAAERQGWHREKTTMFAALQRGVARSKLAHLALPAPLDQLEQDVG